MTRYLTPQLPRSLPTLIAVFVCLAAEILAQPFELPVRGLAIAAPVPDQVDRFVDFVEKELAPRGINTLVLRVDYRYEYEINPRLRSDNPLSLREVKQLVEMGRRNEIRLVPQINLFGHQSWHSRLGKLLEVYPEFDETPRVKLPLEGEYKWPNEDGLYCKSYCPQHPEVHGVVFPLVDELLNAFEADAFHAGLDEIFYIAHDDCQRCRGMDPARLFVDEVRKIRDHLAESGRTLWLWGDRLLNAETTGLGIWEASDSGTHRAIDLLPKDVVICDWHYERAEMTPAFFALHGYQVLACPWNKPGAAMAQLEQALHFRKHSNPKLAQRHLGILHTYWSSAAQFMDLYEAPAEDADEQKLGPIRVLEALFPKAR